MNNSQFLNKVVLITGSSSGIGREIALKFSQLGAQCLIHGRNEERITNVIHECDKVSPNEKKAFPIVADLTSDEGVERIAEAVEAQYGQLDVLINNAGYGERHNIFQDEPLTGLDYHYQGLVRAPFSLIHKTLNLLQKVHGSIINISSIAGVKPFNHSTGYCMARSAMNMMTRCLATDLGPKRIRVNAICPAQINTGSFNRYGATPKSQEAMWNYCENEYPIKRPGYPSDVVNMVLFLASRESEFLTGQCIVLDGGFLDSQPQIMADYGKFIKDT